MTITRLAVSAQRALSTALPIAADPYACGVASESGGPALATSRAASVPAQHD